MQEQLVGNQNIIGVDPGDTISGFCVIENGRISFADNLDNQLIVPNVRELLNTRHYTVVIEDVRPYGTRLSPNLLMTAKFMGQLEWRLKEAGVAFELIPRFEVKKWVYDAFPEFITPKIGKKMVLEDRRREKEGLKRLRAKDGVLYRGNFVWVDDRMIQAAMAYFWQIKKPKPGKRTEFGLKDHGWQALGLITYYINRVRASIFEFPPSFRGPYRQFSDTDLNALLVRIPDPTDQ